MDTVDLARRSASPPRTLVPGVVSPATVMAVSDARASRSTSLLTTANRKLADNPHISTPMMLSLDPRSAKSTEERHRRSQRSHSWQPRSKKADSHDVKQSKRSQ